MTFIPHLNRGGWASALFAAVLALGSIPAMRAQSAPAVSTPVDTSASAGTAGDSASANKANQNVQELAKFVVTDKAPEPFQNNNMDIPRTSDDVQPYIIINRAAIDQSNRVNLEDFLKDYVTQNTTSQTFSQILGAGSGNGTTVGAGGQLGQASQINLSGLGDLATLILINGHRTSGLNHLGVAYQPDINAIPLGAVDRVEVLPSSASAIYGGSAAGGVVNVILKKDYSGGEIDTTYQNTFDTDAPIRTVSGSYGFSIGAQTHLSIEASVSDGKPLVMQDRTFTLSYFEKALHNDPALFYTNAMPYASGATPNIALDTGVVNGYTNPSNTTLILKNGTALNSLITSVPVGTSATTPSATLNSGLLANAGSYNFNFAPSVYRGLNTQIGQVPIKKSIMVSLDHEFGPRLEVYADYSYNSNTVYSSWVPVQNGSGANVILAVPGNAPNNPFQQNVFVSFPMAASQAAGVTYNTTTHSVTVGALAHLPGDWQLAADYTWSLSVNNDYYGLADFLIASTNYGDDAPLLFNGTINPFVDMIANPTTVNSYYGYWKEVFPSELGDLNLRASGPVFNLPGGRPTVTVGLEALENSGLAGYINGEFPPNGIAPNIGTNISNEVQQYQGQRQLTDSAYAELEIPLVGAKNNIPLMNELEIQVAGRAEKTTATVNANTIVNFPDAIPPVVTTSGVGVNVAKYSNTNPTIGLKYKPVQSLTLRVSYATAFIVPPNAELAVSPNAMLSTTAGFP